DFSYEALLIPLSPPLLDDAVDTELSPDDIPPIFSGTPPEELLLALEVLIPDSSINASTSCSSFLNLFLTDRCTAALLDPKKLPLTAYTFLAISASDIFPLIPALLRTLLAPPTPCCIERDNTISWSPLDLLFTSIL